MFTEELKEQCSLPIGYKVGNWAREIVLPDSDPALFGETFWLCETGKKSYLNVSEEGEEPMVVKPGCLAAFVSKGTHWECIVTDLSWS